MPTVYCKQCGKKNRAPDVAIGKKGKCAGCGAVMVIPAQDEAEPVFNMTAEEPPLPTGAPTATEPPPLPPAPPSEPPPLSAAPVAPPPLRSQSETAVAAGVRQRKRNAVLVGAGAGVLVLLVVVVVVHILRRPPAVDPAVLQRVTADMERVKNALEDARAAPQLPQDAPREAVPPVKDTKPIAPADLPATPNPDARPAQRELAPELQRREAVAPAQQATAAPDGGAAGTNRDVSADLRAIRESVRGRTPQWSTPPSSPEEARFRSELLQKAEENRRSSENLQNTRYAYMGGPLRWSAPPSSQEDARFRSQLEQTALRCRQCIEWRKNMTNAINGWDLVWEGQPASEQELQDRKLLERSAVYGRHIREALAAIREGGNAATPATPDVPWTDTDKRALEELWDRKIEEAYSFFLTQGGPGEAAKRVCDLMGVVDGSEAKNRFQKRHPEVFDRKTTSTGVSNSNPVPQQQKATSAQAQGSDVKKSDPAPAQPKPGNKPKSWLSMANQYIKAHNLEKAKEYAKRIVDEAPDSPEAGEAKTILAIEAQK